jgi:hypothetical protein
MNSKRSEQSAISSGQQHINWETSFMGMQDKVYEKLRPADDGVHVLSRISGHVTV